MVEMSPRSELQGAQRRPLVVFIVFFGALPNWLPLTLQSMAANELVDFVVIGNAAAPTQLPPNVIFEHITFADLQVRLSELVTPGNSSSVRYPDTFEAHYAKGNDVKPFAAELYPQHTAGHEWWAWSDLDVVFGDVLQFMDRATRSKHAACCRCLPRVQDGGKGAEAARQACSARSLLQQSQRPGECCEIPLHTNRKTGEVEPKNINLVNVYYKKRFCPCDGGERVNVVCPLYPNPWRKKA